MVLLHPDISAKFLAFSVDSLDVRVGIVTGPSSALLAWARDWRDAQAVWAHGDANPVVSLPGIGDFQVLPGKRRYEFTLTNREIGDIRIWNPERWPSSMTAATGPLYVSFRSKFLLHHGVSGAYRLLSRICRQLVAYPEPEPDSIVPPLEPVAWMRVARVDLAADLQLSRGLTYSDLDTLVTRAQLMEAWNSLADSPDGEGSPLDNREPCNTSTPGGGLGESGGVAPPPDEGADIEADVSRIIARHRRIETLYVGRFGSAQYCRVYDKLKACKVQDKLYHLDDWHAAGWDGESPVWRVEFSISGEALREFRYTTADDGFGSNVSTLHDLRHMSRNIPRLWAFYSSQWLRSVDVSSASRMERCQTLPWWQVVQSAAGEHSPVVRTRPASVPNVKRLVDAARGYLASITAVMSAHTGCAVEALNDVLVGLHDWLTGTDGRERIDLRRVQYGTDDNTQETLFLLGVDADAVVGDYLAAAAIYEAAPAAGVPDLDAVESAYWRRQRMVVGVGS